MPSIKVAKVIDIYIRLQATDKRQKLNKTSFKISKPFTGICMLLPIEYSFTSYRSLCHWILL